MTRNGVRRRKVRLANVPDRDRKDQNFIICSNHRLYRRLTLLPRRFWNIGRPFLQSVYDPAHDCGHNNDDSNNSNITPSVICSTKSNSEDCDRRRFAVPSRRNRNDSRFDETERSTTSPRSGPAR